jgi:hypothetical protein
MHVESWSASVCVSSSLFYVAPRVFFVVSFAFKPRTNLAMNFGRVLCAAVRDFSAVKMQSNPGKGLKTNKRNSVIPGIECSVTMGYGNDYSYEGGAC